MEDEAEIRGTHKEGPWASWPLGSTLGMEGEVRPGHCRPSPQSLQWFSSSSFALGRVILLL